MAISKPTIVNRYIKQLSEVAAVDETGDILVVKVNLWNLLLLAFTELNKAGSNLKSYIEYFLEGIIRDCQSKNH